MVLGERLLVSARKVRKLNMVGLVMVGVVKVVSQFWKDCQQCWYWFRVDKRCAWDRRVARVGENFREKMLIRI